MINVIFWTTLGLICWSLLGILVARLVGKAASCKLPDDWWAYRTDLARIDENKDREMTRDISESNHPCSRQNGRSGQTESD